MCGILEDGVGEMHFIDRKDAAGNGDPARGELRGSYKVAKVSKIPCQHAGMRWPLLIVSTWDIPQRQYLNIVACLENRKDIRGVLSTIMGDNNGLDMGGKEIEGFRGVAMMQIFNDPTEVPQLLFKFDDKSAVENGLHP
ncbi:hypothetical protein H1R20_g13331, partial [Candolleomyces eurysporus]